MKCPKCGKVMFKLENGKYICSPECKTIIKQNKAKNKRIINLLFDDYQKFKVKFTFKGSDKVHTEIIPIDEEYGVVPGAFRELNKRYNNKVDHVLDFELIEEN